jgi:hypothetical protein
MICGEAVCIQTAFLMFLKLAHSLSRQRFRVPEHRTGDSWRGTTQLSIYIYIYIFVTPEQWDQTRLYLCDLWKLSSSKHSASETRMSTEVPSLLNYNLILTTCKVKCQKLFHVLTDPLCHFAAESIHLLPDTRAGGLSLCPYWTFIRDSCPILSVMCLFM